MAELAVEGDELVVRLSAAEKAESFHHDVRLPRAAVRGVEAVDDPVHAVRGWKVVGSSWPGAFAMGTFSSKGRRCFAVVHAHSTGGVRVVLQGARYDEVVVSCEDPARVAAAIAPSP